MSAGARVDNSVCALRLGSRLVSKSLAASVVGRHEALEGVSLANQAVSGFLRTMTSCADGSDASLTLF